MGYPDNIFFLFLQETYITGTQNKHLNEMLLITGAWSLVFNL